VAKTIDAITPAADTRWPTIYDISMGVSGSDSALIEQINAALAREKPQIGTILRAYHVPLETQLSPGGA
jgi:hypothetical protein